MFQSTKWMFFTANSHLGIPGITHFIHSIDFGIDSKRNINNKCLMKNKRKTMCIKYHNDTTGDVPNAQRLSWTRGSMIVTRDQLASKTVIH